MDTLSRRATALQLAEPVLSPNQQNLEILLYSLPGTKNRQTTGLSATQIAANASYTQLRLFRLPDDTERLCLCAASMGVRSAVLAGPGWLEQREIEQEALSICLNTRRSCPEVTNDYAAYRQTFIEAYTLGYRATRTSLNSLSAQLREEVVATVRHLPMDHTLQLYVAMLQTLLQERDLESIYDLLLYALA